MRLLPLLFGVYWLTVLVWSLLAERLCAGLSRRHPLLYATLGRQTAVSSFALVGFLLRRRDRFTGDEELARLCGFMRTLLIVYALAFLTVPAFW